MNKVEQKFCLSTAYYSMEYKQMVCEHYLSGNQTKEEIRNEFKVQQEKKLLQSKKRKF